MQNVATVHGVGINDYEGSVRAGRKFLPSYRYWSDMLRRVKDGRATVCEDWTYFTRFKAWFDTYHKEDHELDKDLFGDGEYAPSKCVFITPELNKKIAKSMSKGCQHRKDNKTNPYRAFGTKGGKFHHLGYFPTEAEALRAAKLYRAQQLTEFREEYYDTIQ